MAPTIDAANNAIAISVFTFGSSFFWLMFCTHQEDKKTADLHQAAKSSVEIFSFRKSLSRTSTLADQGTLPSPTTGCRIRFTESLLMLHKTISHLSRFVKTRRSTLALGEKCGPIDVLRTRGGIPVWADNAGLLQHRLALRSLAEIGCSLLLWDGL